MKKKTGIVAIFISFVLLINICMPIQYIYAEKNVNDDDVQDYAELLLRKATNLTIENDVATIIYENGTATVEGNEMLGGFDDSWNYGDHTGSMYFLYVKSESVTFNFTPSEGFKAIAWENGQRTEVENNQYTVNNLQTKSQNNNGYDIEFTFEDAGENNNNNNNNNGENNGNNNGGEQNGSRCEANITIAAGEGTYTKTVYDPEAGEEHQEEINYDDVANFSINGSRWNPEEGTISYNSNEEDNTVEFAFETLWIDRYYDDIVINGIAYIVSDYLDFDDRTQWLNANHGEQTITFTIPNVPKSNEYNIVVKHGENNGQKYLATFLWTADPSQEYEIERDEHGEPILDENGDYTYILDENGNKIPGKNYIGNSKLEFVKAIYEVGEQTYTVTEEQLEGKLQRRGDFESYTSDDGFLSYGVLADVDYDDGSLTLPGNAEVTMRVVPEYGYQVTSVNGGNDFNTTEEGVSEFTVVVPEGTAGYFLATVEKVDNVVDSISEKVKAGEITLGESAKDDIKNGTVRLTVEDVELSSDKIKGFEDKLNEAGEYTISNYLDINLEKILYKGTEDDVWSEQIHQLSDKALITLQLAEGVDVSNIVIVHNINDGDEYEIINIESYDPETNTISFYTDSFSNYAIATKNPVDEKIEDNKKEEKNTENENAEQTKESEEKEIQKDVSSTPKTGDNIIIYIAILMVTIVSVIGVKKVVNSKK